MVSLSHIKTVPIFDIIVMIGYVEESGRKQPPERSLESSPTPSRQKTGTTQIVTEIGVAIVPEIKIALEIVPEIVSEVAIGTEITPDIEITREIMPEIVAEIAILTEIGTENEQEIGPDVTMATEMTTEIAIYIYCNSHIAIFSIATLLLSVSCPLCPYHFTPPMSLPPCTPNLLPDPIPLLPYPSHFSPSLPFFEYHTAS